MAVKSGFFMSVNGDRKYDASFFAEYFSSFIGNGIFPNPSTNLQIVEGNNMQTVVKPGKGWINGYYVHNDSDFILQHDVADGVLKRIDRVVLQWNYLTRKIEIVLKKGAPASSPVAPALIRNTDYYELALADVLISNGVTRITQANITDTRLNKVLCGIVHGTVDQVDTTTLFNQYQSWIHQQKATYESNLESWTTEQKAEFETWQSLQASDFAIWKSSVETSFNDWMAQEQTDFETWFVTLRDLLDENIAATLTTKVTTLENSVQDLVSDKASNADLETLQNEVNEHLEEKASLTTEGHVRLNSSTNSTNETTAATPKAVKIVYDLATEAKILASKEFIIEKFDVPGTYTWTVPEGVDKVFISGCAGGGGGGASSSTNPTGVTNGSSGGITSFGNYLSLTGGQGGKRNRDNSLGGISGGGYSSDGETALPNVLRAGKGGDTPFGFGGYGKVSESGNGNNGSGFGSGGGGGMHNSSTPAGGGGGGESIIDHELTVRPSENINIVIGIGGSGGSGSSFVGGRGSGGILFIKYIK